MTLSEVLVALVAAIVAEEVLGLTKTVSVWLVRQNAKRLPPEMRESYEEEWLRHLEELHSNLSKLIFAVDLWRASYFIQRESRVFRRDRARIEEKNRFRTVAGQQSFVAGLLDTLTPREMQVLRLVLCGRVNKQIAAELGTGEKTIKVHRARVMHKLGVGSLLELVQLGARLGMYSAVEPAQVPLSVRGFLTIRDEKPTTFRARLSTLTPREMQVLRLVLLGRLNKEIAAELGTVEKTVKVHRSRVMRKMAAGSLIELYQMVVLAGFAPRSDK